MPCAGFSFFAFLAGMAVEIFGLFGYGSFAAGHDLGEKHASFRMFVVRIILDSGRIHVSHPSWSHLVSARDADGAGTACYGKGQLAVERMEKRHDIRLCHQRP